MQVDRLGTCSSQVVMLKVCVIIDLSKFEFFKFSRTETVKEIEKKIKIIQNLLSL